jgi:hypothetical protein
MSLTDLPNVEPVELDQRPTPDHASDAENPPAPRPAAVYMLVGNDPHDQATGYPGGWTLSAHHDTGWSWSTPLSARGAGAHASPRVAQAVAVRVLSEHGVAVGGWSASEPPDSSAHPVSFRARLAPSSPAGAGAGAPSTTWLRDTMSRQLQGH